MTGRPQEARLVRTVAYGSVLAFASACFVPRAFPPSTPAVSSAAPSAASPAPARAKPSWELIRVEPGDTLAGIARCRVISIDALARANAIYDRDRLQVGWHLRVPPGDFCASAAATAARERPASAGAAARKARVHPTTTARRLLDSARTRYDAGDFEASLRDTTRAKQTLSAQRTPVARGLLARAHVIAAMSATGLGDRARAIAEFRRARELDPSVSLADADASPRLVELFRAAASAPGARAAVGDL